MATIVLDAVFAAAPEFGRLGDAVTGLPGDIRRKLWALMAIGRSDYAAKDWERAMMQFEAIPRRRPVDCRRGRRNADQRRRWLPILHTERAPWHFTAL